MTRREFLSSLSRLIPAALPPLLGLFRLGRLTFGTRSNDPRGAPKVPVIPPGSRSLDHFTTVCTACNRCIASCPTRVLQPTLLEYGLRGVLQPVLDFAVGYCDYLCTACGRVCPTGAIMRLHPREKQRTKIGSLHFVQEDCIVFRRGTPCGACAEICPTQAIRMVAFRPGLTQPLADAASCIGCGACEYVCPARPRKAIYVAGVDPHTTAALPGSAPAPSAGPPLREKEPRVSPASPGDFPF